MQKTKLAAASLATAIAALMHAAPAGALPSKTWVAALGVDGNPCTIAQPCRTLTFALSQTAAGGEIDILGPGDYGVLTIQKAISIASDGEGAGIQPLNASAITVNAAATDAVQLRGLTLDGAANTSSGFEAIGFLSGAALLVQDCILKNFQNGVGIYFAPNTAATLVVSDTIAVNDGSVGIYVAPSAGPTKVALERVVLDGNAFGMFVGGSSAGAVNVTVTESLATNNTQDGIVAAPSGSGPVAVMVEHSRSVNNGYGVRSFGAGTTVLLNNSTITGNGSGLAFSGGVLGSYGTNTVDKNSTDGAPSKTFAPK